MEPTDKCMLCGETGEARELGVWVVDDAPRPIHVTCWITADEADRLQRAAVGR